MNSQPEGKSVAELAALVGGQVVGDETIRVYEVTSLERARRGSVAFVENVKLLDGAARCDAACLVVPEGAAQMAAAAGYNAAGKGKCLIEAAHPKLAFAVIAAALHGPPERTPSIHPLSSVSASAELSANVFIDAFVRISERAVVGEGTQVYAGAVIGAGVRLGRGCVVHPNVVLYDGVRIGDRVILHAGVCIGADGFGYVRGPAGYHKFPQVGTVVIEDDVEIGAHSCIDRGALGVTRIGRGTKIDNLVQVAHNVEIGERVVIAAQTGISGSTVIEDDAVIGGQVGMGDHARVQRGAIVGSKAGILPGKIVRSGAVVWGIPVRPLDEYKRLNAHFGRLPHMRAELDELRREVRELKEKMSAEER